MKIDFFQNLIEFEEINSTNDYLKTNYKDLPNFTVVQTQYQTKGRGQFDRVWEAEKDKNLLVSILFKEEIPVALNDTNVIVIVNVIMDVFKEYGVDDVSFKYPNDICFHTKKLGGILIEKQYDNRDIEYMIVGIGVNINQENFKNANATSLKNIIKKEVDVKQFLDKLLLKFSSKLE